MGWTNLALAQLKLPDMVKDAVESCGAALVLQPKNIKAMYLRAQALLSSDSVTRQARNEAIAMLKSLLEIAPENDSAQKLLESAYVEAWNWQDLLWPLLLVLLGIFFGIGKFFYAPVSNEPSITMT